MRDRLGDLHIATAHPAESLSRGRALLTPADPAAEPGGVAEAERQVVDAVQGVDQAEILVHEAQASGVRGGRVAQLEVLAPDAPGGSVVGAVKASEDLDECRLARAVLADQGVDLAWSYLEADVGERLRPGERLAQVAKFKHRIRAGRPGLAHCCSLVRRHARSNTTG